MSDEKHTPGMLAIKHEWNLLAGERLVANAGGYSGGNDPSQTHHQNIANAARLAAAWNFVDGVPTSALTPGGLRALVAAARLACKVWPNQMRGSVLENALAPLPHPGARP